MQTTLCAPQTCRGVVVAIAGNDDRRDARSRFRRLSECHIYLREITRDDIIRDT